MARLLAPIDLSQRDAISVEITRKLIDYLLSGHVRPGQRLPPERKLAQALGVGRSVVREALKSLTLLGLMEVRRGDGTYLKRTDAELLPPSIEWGLVLSGRDLRDLGELLGHLEVIIAELAAARRNDETIMDLRDLLVGMRLVEGDPGRFLAAEAAFGAHLAAAARNEVLSGIMSTVRSLIQVRLARAADSAVDVRRSLDHYARLLDAVERGDVIAAQAAAMTHAASEESRLSRWLPT